MAAYQVSGACVIAKKEDGGDLHLYEGAAVPKYMPADWIKRHITLGLIAETDAPPDEPKDDGKPAGNASLEAWSEYAKANGKTDADLDGLGRDDVRDLFA